MKLSFTTLGCQEWKLDEIIEKALKFGYAGVDFRGYGGELDLWKLPEFGAEVATTRRKFSDAGLAIPCLGSSAKMYSVGENVEKSLDEVRYFSEIAHNLGTPYIRIFGGSLAGVPFKSALPAAAEFLQAASAIARSAGIEVLVETHDDWVDTEWLLEAFSTAGFPKGVNILWDIHHPYRLAGEDPDATWTRIGAYVRYTHWKDSVLVGKAKGDDQQEVKFTLCLPGEGDLPLQRFYELLDDSGYTGWYAFEWERKWHPELPPADVAFPRFVKVMKALEGN